MRLQHHSPKGKCPKKLRKYEKASRTDGRTDRRTDGQTTSIVKTSTRRLKKHVCYIQRSYHTTHPNPPRVTESGWQKNEDGIITPVYCLVPSAPKDCLNYVVDCGCTTGCNKSRFCKCLRNGNHCTSLCKCSDNCINKSTESTTTD